MRFILFFLDLFNRFHFLLFWLNSFGSAGSNLEAITTCELCKEKLHLNIENFDINELYRSHERVSARVRARVRVCTEI